MTGRDRTEGDGRASVTGTVLLKGDELKKKKRTNRAVMGMVVHAFGQTCLCKKLSRPALNKHSCARSTLHSYSPRDMITVYFYCNGHRLIQLIQCHFVISAGNNTLVFLREPPLPRSGCVWFGWLASPALDLIVGLKWKPIRIHCHSGLEICSRIGK